MKLLMVFLAVVMAQGCASDIAGWKINKVLSLCEQHKGIDEINLVLNYVICNDATWFHLTTVDGGK